MAGVRETSLGPLDAPELPGGAFQRRKLLRQGEAIRRLFIYVSVGDY